MLKFFLPIPSLVAVVDMYLLQNLSLNIADSFETEEEIKIYPNALICFFPVLQLKADDNGSVKWCFLL